MADRIPPESEDLEFIRNKRTGTVHVEVYCPDPRDTDEPVRRLADCTDEEAMDIILGQTAMLCGERFAMCPGGHAEYVSEFPDEKLCRGCWRALGDQSSRAFEHPQGDGAGQAAEHPAFLITARWGR